ncbi:MAG: hypothetical protein A2Y10_13140 [Planctomycetes bacterium GWF2_41_51]|nr:MAG: hypothetical protein A2Y10_13140 [Planctomycetes bacterium GWF2_41_51]HBG60698.1 hypothetical protein [Candidatus Omnitrophota bacterium]
MEIKQIDAKLTSQIRYYYLELEVNNKDIEISFWRSYDDTLDCCYEDGWELIDRNIDLTDDEKDAIDDYIYNLDLSQIK